MTILTLSSRTSASESSEPVRGTDCYSATDTPAALQSGAARPAATGWRRSCGDYLDTGPAAAAPELGDRA